MKNLILLFAIAACAHTFAASPAATQQWVRNYVSTNTTGVTEEWVKRYVAEYGGGKSTDYSTTTVNGIINNTFLAASLSRVSATNSAYKVTTATTTNEQYRILAKLSGWLWTNAVAGISFRTNATTATYNSESGLWSTTNFTASVIKFYANETTNIPSVVVLPYLATDKEIREAKGENE